MKTFLYVFILSIPLLCNAQTKPGVEYSSFEKWAKTISIPPYKLMNCEEDGMRYVANFMNGSSKFVQISIEDVSRFMQNQNKGLHTQNYSVSGKNAIFLSEDYGSFLCIEDKKASLSINIGCSWKSTKTDLEAILNKLNWNALQSINVKNENRVVNWPVSIPVALQLPSVMSIKDNGSDGTYKNVYEVRARFSTELIDVLKSLMIRYKTSNLGEGIVEGNAQLICSSAETIEQLQEQFKNGQEVSFIYYVN